MSGRVPVRAFFSILCLLVFLALAGQSVSAADHRWYEIYFSRASNDVAQARADPHSIDRALAQKIALATVSVDAALHEIDSDRIAQALLAARGLRVRLVTEHDYMDELAIEDLTRAGIPIVSDEGRGGLMHHKFLVIDSRYVWTGSFNTTDNDAFKNDNNAIWIESPKLATNYTAAFLEMFELRSFGRRPQFSLPYPEVKMPDGTTVQTLFAPHHNVVRQLVDVIKSAEKSVYFMAFSFTHDGIGQAMQERYDAGVDVRGVLETRGTHTPYAEFNKMQKQGIAVRRDINKWAMHHKVIMIDARTVTTGSFNFSENAARSNNENVLIIRDNPAIAARFMEEFQRLTTTPGPSQATPAVPQPLPAGALNINTATPQQLETLPGIGPTLAQRIIAGRPYGRLQDLQRVCGLGPRTIEALQGRVGFQ
jgi:phosphatidylserine/phosphatidylglycerophosphate/cardiolipin synthase-like enzyme